MRVPWPVFLKPLKGGLMNATEFFFVLEFPATRALVTKLNAAIQSPYAPDGASAGKPEAFREGYGHGEADLSWQLPLRRRDL